MKLVKGRACDLPVGLLVQIAEGHRIGQELIEFFGHFQADWFFKFQRQSVVHGAIFLDLTGFLVKVRLGSDATIVSQNSFLRHRNSPL